MCLVNSETFSSIYIHIVNIFKEKKKTKTRQLCCIISIAVPMNTCAKTHETCKLNKFFLHGILRRLGYNSVQYRKKKNNAASEMTANRIQCFNSWMYLHINFVFV